MTTVTIRWDDWGMPHVNAATEEAGYFGMGYAQASEQLDLMLEHYLFVRGEAASVLGASHVPIDVQSRMWRHLEESRACFARFPEQLQRNLAAFIAGVERFMADHPKRVPAWAPPLEPALPAAVNRTMLWPYMFRDALEALVAAGVTPSIGLGGRGSVRGGQSNEWVLMPWRTADDCVILLSDPHGEIAGHAQMFECAVEAGPLKSVGVVFVGGATPFLGHTRHVAWGMTTGSPRVSDCYVVECDPDDPRRYLVDGEPKTMVAREETIPVLDAEPVTHTIEYTEHNGLLCPVVARAGPRAYVVSTPYTGDTATLERELYGWQTARDVHEFRDAMRGLGMFPQNVMAGDHLGNVAYVRAGCTPIRAEGVDCTRPVDGNTSATRWHGVHPFDDLVQIVNPPSGYMQNNNLAPDAMFDGASQTSLSPHGYPPYVFNDTSGRTHDRGVRAVELLGNQTAATVQDAIEIAVDDYWPHTPAWIAALRRATFARADVAKNWSERTRALAHRVLQFDGYARPESAEALAYFYWRSALATALPPDGCRELRRAVESGGLGKESLPVLLDAVSSAERTMDELHGRTDLPFGEVFRMGRGGRSWPGRGGMFGIHTTEPFPLGGGDLTDYVSPLRLVVYSPPDERGQRWASFGGRSLRLTAFTDPIQSYSVVLFGQSPHEHSPHHSDQVRLFSEGKVRRTYFNERELDGHVVRSVELEA